MTFTKLICGWLVALILLSCNKEEVEEYPMLEVDEELKDYFVHDKGTMYVMVDTAENMVDTLVIINSSYHKGTLPEGSDKPNGHWSPFYLVRFEAKVGEASAMEQSFQTSLETLKLSGDTYNRFKYINGQSRNFLLTKNGEWDPPEDVVTRKDSLNILGVTYYDVLELEFSRSHKMVYGKNVGPLRIENNGNFLLQEKIEP